MAATDLGVLQPTDPLHAVLVGAVGNPPAPRFRVWRLEPGGGVYRYVEGGSGAEVVAKFYGSKWLHGARGGQRQLRARLLHREYTMLHAARDAGLDSAPYAVVRPLALSEATDLALIEEYVPGRDLGDLISAATAAGGSDRLHAAVDDAAALLARLHTATATHEAVDPHRPLRYLAKVLDQLEQWGVIDEGRRTELAGLGERWRGDLLLAGATRCLVHGDATPAHFLFESGVGVTAIDLERATYADPAGDLGRLAAELRHLSFWRTGDPAGGEPLIQRLYATYTRHADADLGALTRRGQLFMAGDLLRISRNCWLDLDYRRRLIAQGAACLRR